MTDIKLELDPKTRQERLVGLNGELIPDSRIITAVAINRRLFPHVVKHLAVNQYVAKNPECVYDEQIPPDEEMLSMMREIRDELADGMSQCTVSVEMVE